MNKCVIRPIPLCKGVRNKSQLTYREGPGEKVEICCYVWYIEGPEQKILIDAGTSADWYHANGVPQQEHIQYIEEGLGELGLQPKDIAAVILTHLHADHVEQARKFTNAKFFVQKDELDATKHPAMASEYVINLLQGLEFTIIEGDAQIDDGVRVLFTPGHTPGTQSVAVETSRGIAVICGFCSIDGNFYMQTKASGICAPGVFTNLLQAYDSVKKVKKIADILIPIHDMKYTNIKALP
jgi:N-acyl homoserine lactone hydrolase